MILTELIGEPAILEQLAEESAELSQAALKLARIERRENPTRVPKSRAVNHLVEEMTDVFVCIAVLEHMGYKVDYDLADKKLIRWYARLYKSMGGS